MVNAHEIFANNIQAAARQKPVNIGHTTGHCVFNRHHRQRYIASAQGRESVVESGAGQNLHIRIEPLTRDMRVGPGLTLKCYFRHNRFLTLTIFYVLALSSLSASARSSGASTPTGTVSTQAAAMLIPASKPRNCSKRSRWSSGDGGNDTNFSKAAR